MNMGITHKLFLAILAAALLSVASLVVIMQWSLGRGFLRYINTIEQARLSRLATSLEERYAVTGSWDFLKRDPAEWRRLLAASLPEEEARHAGMEATTNTPSGIRPERVEHPPVPPHLMRGFHQRVILCGADRQPLINPTAAAEQLPELTPLRSGAAVVGYLGILPRKKLSDEHQIRFLREQKTAFSLVGGTILLLTAGFSHLLSFRLIRPLRSLAKATDDLAAGRYDTRVAVTSSDELGQLARDFNSLALSLEQNEQARRGWVADISHELRTPLAVLRGELEAIQDGVRPMERGAINSLHQETLRLGRLVDDLYQLSLSDVGALSYRKKNVDLVELLQGVALPYRDDFGSRGITLQVALPTTRAIVFADPSRLEQLFANLLDNSLKYTDQGGSVAVRLACNDTTATVEIEDSAPGVGENELERLFDRLYRVESSRNRAGGGAGLGLAICRNIAVAHEGSITALQSPLGGLLIRVVLPLWGGE